MTQKHFATLYRELNRAIGGRLIDARNGHAIKEKGIDLLQQVIRQLHHYLYTYEFSDAREELQFFKKTAPKFYSLYIYYVIMYDIERKCVLMKADERRKYLSTRENYCRNYLEQHAALYNKMLVNDKSTQDLFRRSSKGNASFFPNEYACVIDHRVCTTGAFFISNMMAYQRVLGELCDR